MNLSCTRSALVLILVLLALGAAACTQSKPNVPTPTLVPLPNETIVLPTNAPLGGGQTPVAPAGNQTPVPSANETIVPPPEDTIVPPPPGNETLVPPPPSGGETAVPPAEPTLMPTPTIAGENQPPPAPPATSEPGSETDGAATGACTNPYTVQAGDWLYKIARQCGISPQALINANPGIDRVVLRAGMKLRIPGGGNVEPQQPPSQPPSEPGACGPTYVVKKGDTLFSIAQRCGSSVGAIMQANNIPAPEYIFPGQVITIPGH